MSMALTPMIFCLSKNSRQRDKSPFCRISKCFVTTSLLGKTFWTFQKFADLFTFPSSFDETEFIVTPPPDSIVKTHPVFFSGVLQIESLNWLSEEGLRCLETDFKDYNNKIHPGDNRGGLTLQRLYGSPVNKRLYLKVEVVYEKVLFAAYLTCAHPFNNWSFMRLINTMNSEERAWTIAYIWKNRNGVCLSNRSHCIRTNSFAIRHATFSVKSLQKKTFDMSRNFLDRYRLRALIVELVELDRGKTPLEDRNIDWLLGRYFEHIIPRDLKNRIVVDPSLEREILLEPRHLRHIPRGEIRGYFASQAEWLLANQLASISTSANVKLVDIPQWIAFCLQVRTEVEDARNYGVRWGLPHKTAQELKYHRKWTLPNLSLPQRLAKFGQTESFWAKRLENVTSPRKTGGTKQSKVSRLFPFCNRFSIASSASKYNSRDRVTQDFKAYCR